MIKRANNIIAIAVICMLIVVNISYAEQIIDKKGRVVTEITQPTAESTIDPDTISSADRRVVSVDSEKYEGPKKNIFSNFTIYTGVDETLAGEEKDYTLIRHTSSITDLTDEKYFLNNDAAKDRMRLTIVTSDGIIEGKDGFFKIDDKIYYFDETGLMVLGPCYDTIGNYYFFSYDTGEMIEEIQKR